MIRDAAIVLDDQLQLLARDGIAILLQVELRAGCHLLAGRGEWSGERRNQADLISFLVCLLRLRGSEDR